MIAAVGRSPLEERIRAAGFRPQPFAQGADLNAAAESRCPGCMQLGTSELRPFWKGPSCRLVIRCLCCGHEQEG